MRKEVSFYTEKGRKIWCPPTFPALPLLGRTSEDLDSIESFG